MSPSPVQPLGFLFGAEPGSAHSLSDLTEVGLAYVPASRPPKTGRGFPDVLSGALPYKFQPLQQPPNSNSASSVQTDSCALLGLQLPVLGCRNHPRILISPSGLLSGDSRIRQYVLGNRSKAPSRTWPCLCSIPCDS